MISFRWRVLAYPLWLTAGLVMLAGPTLALPLDEDDRLQNRGVFSPLFFTEFQDIDLVGDLAYVWGVSGLVVMDVSDVDTPTMIGRYEPPGDPWERYYRGAVFGNLAVGGAREDLLHIFNVADPLNPRIITVHGSPGLSYEGAAMRDSLAFVCRHGDGLEILDLRTPANPVTLGLVTDLVNSWDVALQGDVAYVADGLGGLAVIDISDLGAPVLVAHMATSGSANDVEIDGNVLAVTTGSAGLDLFTLDDPLAPLWVSNTNTSGLAIGVSLAADKAYVADWDDVEVFDIADPTDPLPAGGENTPVRAMGLAARADLVVVADWFHFRAYQPGPTTVGDIEIIRDGLDFGVVPLGSFKDLSFTIGNTGGGPVTISDLLQYSPNFTVISPTSGVVPAGGTFEVTVRFTPAAVGHDASFINIISDDTDEGSFLYPLNADNNPVALDIGDPAPDFSLTDMGGATHNLISYRGKVVVLAFFANW